MTKNLKDQQDADASATRQRKFPNAPSYKPNRLPDEYEVLRIHNEIIDFFLGDGEEIDIQNDRYQEVLQMNSVYKRNLLHLAIHRLKDRKMAASQGALELFEDLVLQNPIMFKSKDEFSIVPLLSAAEFNVEILFRIIDLLIPKSLLEDIENVRHDDGDCPLLKVSEKRRLQCRKRNTNLPNDTNGYRPMTPESTHFDEVVSCLHSDIDVEVLIKKDRELRSALKEALQPSPERSEKKKSCLESLIVPFNFSPEHDGKRMPMQSFETLLELCDSKIFETEQNGYSPLQRAVSLYSQARVDHQILFSVIKALVKRCPSSIYFSGTDGKTAYRMLKEPQNKRTAPKEQEYSKKTEEEFKRICIGSPDKTREDKKAFLYWDTTSVCEFDLNLKTESVQIDQTYIQTIRDQAYIKFETVLSSVELPYWKPEGRNLSISRSQHNKTEDTADPYISIFQWLWDCNVRKIFTVDVDDDGPEPHTNSSIRMCLKGRSKESAEKDDNSNEERDFGVEIWKWKKFDLCIDTIRYAAPQVKDVYLYCSGNTAILRAWASKSGVPTLKYLEKLTVEVYPKNAKDMEDCKEYQPTFVAKLMRRCKCLKYEIDIKYPEENISSSSLQGASQERGRKDIVEEPVNEKLRSEEWIAKLKPLQSFVANVLNPRPVVKIALLDDGAKLSHLDGKQVGTSFRPDNVQFWVGPCSHGTEMARCIRKICPEAELYIARLDDSRKDEPEKFTIKSALEALKWALAWDVDIISMSWSFKKAIEGEKDEHEKDFIKLVEGLSSSKVVLFGSLPDKGPNEDSDHYAPVSLAGVIRIGSATIYGTDSESNKFAKKDFRLPGEEIQGPSGDVVSGSSYATAYAAGLAGLMLCCIKAHMELNDPFAMKGAAYPDDIRTKRLNKAKTAEGMKMIFKVLSGESVDAQLTDAGFFVRPYSALNITFDDDDDSEEGKKSNMQDIVEAILPHNKVPKA